MYSAQKERDAAVMRRLRIANDERDDAMSRMKRYDHEFDSGTDVGSMDGDFDPINNNAVSIKCNDKRTSLLCYVFSLNL